MKHACWRISEQSWWWNRQQLSLCPETGPLCLVGNHARSVASREYATVRSEKVEKVHSE